MSSYFLSLQTIPECTVIFFREWLVGSEFAVTAASLSYDIERYRERIDQSHDERRLSNNAVNRHFPRNYRVVVKSACLQTEFYNNSSQAHLFFELLFDKQSMKFGSVV